MYEDSVQALNVELASKTKQVTIYQNQIEVMKIEAAQKQSEFELALNQERHKLDVKKVANLEREKNEYKEENKSLYEKLKDRETQSQLLAVKVDSVELQKDNMAKQLDGKLPTQC
jgi:phenylacetate-coenzyme A ligase PaaK-like adenylate-forming protein